MPLGALCAQPTAILAAFATSAFVFSPEMRYLHTHVAPTAPTEIVNTPH